MKLNDVLRIAFAGGPLVYKGGYTTYHLMGEYLETIKDLILKTDEFSDVESISFVIAPTFIDENGQFGEVSTMKVRNETRFKGKIKLYSIGYGSVCNIEDTNATIHIRGVFPYTSDKNESLIKEEEILL